MTEMDMALKMISAIEDLSPDDFIVEYNKMFNENISINKINWNGFPVYYDPEA